MAASQMSKLGRAGVGVLAGTGVLLLTAPSSHNNQITMTSTRALVAGGDKAHSSQLPVFNTKLQRIKHRLEHDPAT